MLRPSRGPRTWLAAYVGFVAALLFPRVGTALPVGESPFIYGMHDDPGDGFFPVVDGCHRGWVTELRYIGDSGTCGAGEIDMTALSGRGLGVIMRLDVGGAPSLPPNPANWDAFAATFADCVQRSRGVRVWVVGNEPNLPWGHPENRTFRPDEVADIYARVLAAVDALPGGDGQQVLLPALAPWAALSPWGDWDDGLAATMDNILQRGSRVDGLAIHAYTRADFSPAAVTSDAWFPGRENKWHLHFRGYRDTMALLAARNLFNLPLYITESGNACDPPCDPYPDVDVGYFVAMYEEVHAWNVAHPSQVIRAVTPYRWTLNDDGSGRDFCLGCSNPIKSDFSAAMGMGRSWTSSGCSNAPDSGMEGDAGPSVDASTPTDAGLVSLTDGSTKVADGGDPMDASVRDGGGGTRHDSGGEGGRAGDTTSNCACESARNPEGAAGSAGLWGAVVGLVLALRRRQGGNP